MLECVKNGGKMNSTSIKATNKKGTKLNWWEYWIGHCWMTGWQSIGGAFRIWCDLMTDNYKDYALLQEDDDAEECREWFWVSLGEDNVYSKEFLEYLMQLSDDVQSGRVETYSMEDVMKKLEWSDEILKDLNLDEELSDDDDF